MMAAQRLELLQLMQELQITFDLLKSIPSDEIRHGCLRLRQSGLDCDSYSGLPGIQMLLILDESFPRLYKRLLEGGMSKSDINTILTLAAGRQLSLTGMAPETLLSISALPLKNADLQLEFYQLFGDRGLREPYRDVLCRNVTWYHERRYPPLLTLTGAQRAMLWQPYISIYILPSPGFLPQALNILARNAELQSLLAYLYQAKVQLCLRDDDLELLGRVARQQRVLLESLLPLLAPEIRQNGSFFQLWLENGAHEHDLALLNERLKGMDAKAQSAVFASRLSYIAALYGKALEAMPLETLNDKRRSVLIFAVAHRQHAFLRLIRDNFALFQSLPIESMLFQQAFYTRCQLNSITAADLKACGKVPGEALSLNSLEEAMYTFRELQALAYAPKQYPALYRRLTLTRVDDKLLVIRQLLKHRLLPADLTEGQMEELARRLSQKPLDRWLQADFSHIPNMDKRAAVELLANLDAVQRFLPDIHKAEEASYAVRNRENLKNCSCWAEAQKELAERDSDWQELVRRCEFSEAFLAQYSDGVMHFIEHNGPQLVNTYLSNTRYSKQEAIRRIVQAEIMQRFRDLKYHDEDLSLELDYSITAKQKAAWMRNSAMTALKYRVEERDDLYSTMRIGEVPTHTCLSYKNGGQLECLLACFDANKKFLFALRDGVPVARAMIRLTVCSFESRENHASLQFADLQENKPSSRSDELALFLERVYARGLNNTEMRQIEGMFVRLMRLKACELGAWLILGRASVTNPPRDFIRMRCYLYISHSKAGVQYLDSLEGANSVSQEGSYRQGSFYMLKDNEEKTIQ